MNPTTVKPKAQPMETQALTVLNQATYSRLSAMFPMTVRPNDPYHANLIVGQQQVLAKLREGFVSGVLA